MMKVTKDNVSNLLSSMRGMSKKRVLIGIPSEKGHRKGDPISNATLGRLNEFGSALQNIPARPFLQPGVKAARGKLVLVLKGAAKKGLKDKKAVEVGLEKAGIIAQSSVKKIITEGKGFKPLKASTLAARKRVGAKGIKPLIRTGQLLNSITYVVKDK